MGKRVLVIEDDFLNRMMFCAVLREGGYDVEEVTDERLTLREAEQFGPDLIVLDIHLPYVSGIDIIKLLKSSEKLRSIPVLAVTGYVGKGEEQKVRSAGASGYLAKPVSMKPLLDAVGGLLPH
ncbi:response regulator [Allopontixanthobacter sp.]|uniref:response regulator n=1 Tax=Allopontixanthobacter sp. TaxID=2906452 RepID=UPI002ABA7CDF|nr:response regulator [Allopontixanthobacter sp.]MDZ4306897.1 response regulator [Allopontixanthobacter sp.]